MRSGRPAPPLAFSGMERLRYSDRMKLAEEGSLGPLSYEKVPERLGTALGSAYEHAGLDPVPVDTSGRVFL